MSLFSSPEGSLAAAIAALLLVLGYRFARPDAAREWLAFAAYAGAIAVTFLASRGNLGGPAVEAGWALRVAGAVVLVVGLVIAGSGVRAGRRAPPSAPSSSKRNGRGGRSTWLGLALVLVGFVVRMPSRAGGVAVLLAIVLAGWAALRSASPQVSTHAGEPSSGPPSARS